MTHEEWEVKYEIDINNPLKSIKEIYDDIKRKLAIKSIIGLNIKEFIKLLRRKDYPRRAYLESSNGEIGVVFSKEPESLDKLLKYFKVEYKVSKNNIKESEIYEIVKKYGMDPKATFIDTTLYVTINPHDAIKEIKSLSLPIGPIEVEFSPFLFVDPTYPVRYIITGRKNPDEDKLIIEALPYIERNKKLYNSLRETLERFRISEANIEKVLADIKKEKRAEISLLEGLPVEEFINIYLEGVKKGYILELFSSWKISEGHGGRIELYYNPKGYHIIEIGIYPPTEEKMKQLLTDMKNIGMDTRIKKITIFYI